MKTFEMNPVRFAWCFLAVVGILVACLFAVGSCYQWRAEWPLSQMRNAHALTVEVMQFKQSRGEWPDHLHQIVEVGMIDEAMFAKLKFQSSPWSKPLDWTYSKPSPGNLMMLMSPEVMPRKWGSTGGRIVFFPDGGGELVTDEKWEGFKREAPHRWLPP